MPLVEGLDSGATSVTDKVVSFPEIGLEVKVDLTYEKLSGDDFTIVNTIQIKELSIDNPEITEIVLNTSKSSYDHEVGSGNILYIDSIKIKGHSFTDISTGLIDDVLNYWSGMTHYINNDYGLFDKLGAYTEPVSGYEVNYSDADASISATGTLDILKIAIMNLL